MNINATNAKLPDWRIKDKNGNPTQQKGEFSNSNGYLYIVTSGSILCVEASRQGEIDMRTASGKSEGWEFLVRMAKMRCDGRIKV